MFICTWCTRVLNILNIEYSPELITTSRCLSKCTADEAIIASITCVSLPQKMPAVGTSSPSSSFPRMRGLLRYPLILLLDPWMHHNMHISTFMHAGTADEVSCSAPPKSQFDCLPSHFPQPNPIPAPCTLLHKYYTYVNVLWV